ncbi:MAG: macrolide ABC transporter ATP-binding protein [Spirochaetes bacterium GWF1_41_5]|nr:MAG: macrolide ABC transporter ATP-binding protein [Spirochaetes bacterium GWF1_41_5]HBE01658.1 macrolide ABC transporter ATP-binding protein [Spirochaetia bacterium]
MLISCKNVYKNYLLDKITVTALKDISFSLEKGSFAAILGPSGSGKSTLMNVLGCLDTPSSGEYLLDGIDTGRLSKIELSGVRNKKIGFVFQSFNLLSRYNVFHNVELPLMYADLTQAQRKTMVLEAIKLVGLEDRLKHRPNELSGGQRQRVAIARALVNKPEVIFADEPTGNLDSHTGREIMKIFARLNDEGKTIILVTHDLESAKITRQKIVIRDGMISENTGNRP